MRILERLRTRAALTPLLLASLGFVTARAAENVPKGAVPPLSTSPQKTPEIQARFDERNYAEVIRLAIQAESEGLKPEALAQVRNLHGLAFLLTQRPVQGNLQFQKALEAVPTQSPLLPYLQFNLAASYYTMGKISEAKEKAGLVSPESVDRETRQKLLLLRAQIAVGTGQWEAALRELLALGRIASDLPGGRGQASPLLDSSLKKLEDNAKLEALLREFEDSSFADVLLYRIAQLEIAQQRESNAKARLELLTTHHPQSPLYADAMQLLRSVGGSASPSGAPPVITGLRPAATGAIGLLVPLTGKFAAEGQRALRSAQLALGVFGKTSSESTLFVEDAGDDPESALRALERLILTHGVSVVVGPILSKGTELLNQRAEELGTPLLSLAQIPGPLGATTIAAGIPPQLQAREIARFAIERKGWRRFAILHPRNKLGEQYASAFWDAVEELGGRITGIEAYNPGETDFRQPIDRLAGLYLSDARAREQNALAKARATQNIKKRTRKTEQFFALPPIVDFDAVFLPEEPETVGLIIPTFAYRDVDGIPFLGTSLWKSPELLGRIQNPDDRLFFPEAFSGVATDAASRKFIQDYKSQFGVAPGAVDALVADAVDLADLLIHESKEPEAILRSIEALRDHPGVVGRMTYQNKSLGRTLRILTAQNGNFAEAMRPPVGQRSSTPNR